MFDTRITIRRNSSMENMLNESAVESLLKRGNMALDDYKFKEARQCFDQVLNIEPESGAAYIGLAMASARTPNKKEFLWYCVDQHGKDNRNLRRAREFANGEWAEFFEDVDKEIAQKEQESAEIAKVVKKTALIIAVLGIFVIALCLTLPHIIYAPAEQLYKDGRYEQAYKKAADISQNGIGKIFDDKVEKYAYAYLIDFLEESDKALQGTISGGYVVTVFPVSGSTIEIYSGTKTDKYATVWDVQIYDDAENMSCMFAEYISGKARFILSGKFKRSSYTSGKSIEYSITYGYPNYVSSQAEDIGEQTIAEALALIERNVGIKAEHLGFDSYKQ